jgi:hypothetical protein
MATTVSSFASQDDDVLAYHNKEAKDDSANFVACVFQDWQAAMAEGRKFDFALPMTDEKIERFSVLVSQVVRPVQPPPLYATDIIPPGLTEEEALQRALQNSAPHPPPPPPLLFTARGLLHLHHRWHRRMFRRLQTRRGRYRNFACSTTTMTTTRRSGLGYQALHAPFCIIFFIFLYSLRKLCLKNAKPKKNCVVLREHLVKTDA